MTPLKRLYLVAGFNDPDIERQISNLQRKFESGTFRFVSRPYPVKPDKRFGYLRGLVHAANDVIFGVGTATNFCRKLDQPCLLEAKNSNAHRPTCVRTKAGETACGRLRPQLVIVICADQLFGEALDRLGRGTLILRLPGPKLPETADLKAAIDAFEPSAEAVQAAVTQRAKALYAPLIPDCNFQRLGGYTITAEAQADPLNFSAILNRHHSKLYRGDFVNPKKSGIRGAYMLDDSTAFQQDHLHKTVQTIGLESRKDGFHLLNAYHTYGVKSDPGFHFDVMNIKSDSIGHILHDILSGKPSDGGEKHLNATPCDRVI